MISGLRFDLERRYEAEKAAHTAYIKGVVTAANEFANGLTEDEKHTASVELHKRMTKEWLERRKQVKDSDNIVSIEAAVALFANAGREVVNVRKVHRHFAYLNGFVYYITIEGSARPFVVRGDTGAIYDGPEFDQKYPDVAALTSSLAGSWSE